MAAGPVWCRAPGRLELAEASQIAATKLHLPHHICEGAALGILRQGFDRDHCRCAKVADIERFDEFVRVPTGLRRHEASSIAISRRVTSSSP